MSVNRLLFVMQAVLVLHDGYLLDKVAQIEHKIPHFKQCISWGLGVWGLAAASCRVYDRTTSGYADL
jgi:hypothetical protein